MKLSFLSLMSGLHQMGQRLLGVAIKHFAIRLEKQRIFESRKTPPTAPLEHDDRFGSIHFQDRHSGNWTLCIVARVGIYDVIGANNDRDVRGRKLRIDVLEFV